MGAVEFLFKLFAGKNGFFGIDDNDEITAVDMWGIVSFEFAAQQIGGKGRGFAQGLAGGVKDVPFTDDGILVGHSRGHCVASIKKYKKFDNLTACP